MAVANPERGDVEIELGEHKFIMRPTPGATAEIEAGAAKGTLALINAVADRTITLRELAVVVCAGIRASGDGGANVRKCEELIWRAGFVPALVAVQSYLLRSVNGGREALPFVGEQAGSAWNESPSESGSPSQSSTSGGSRTSTGGPPGTTSTPQWDDSSSSSVALAADPRETGGVPIPRRGHKTEQPPDEDWTEEVRKVGVPSGSVDFEQFRREVVGE